MCAVDAKMVGSHSRRRIAVASMVGTTVEFYDFYIYATAAVSVFPHLFFPKGNGTTALLASLATFGLAFVARPLGSVLFGHFGDRAGRKATLVGLAVDHGDRHFHRRGAADLPAGGRRGAGAAGDHEVQPGPRVGRRVGRSGTAGHRNRRTRQEGASGDVATAGRTIRFPAG